MASSKTIYPPAHNPISDTSITITHRTITSQRSFEDTKAALESAIPPLNNTWLATLQAGNTAGALAELRALPALNNFILPGRDFGRLITVWGITGKKAVQYEIGNPYTASKLVRTNLKASLYPPIRVALVEDSAGVVQFIYDRPITTFGQFDDPNMTSTAEALDSELTQLFLFSGGWPSLWPLPAQS